MRKLDDGVQDFFLGNSNSNNLSVKSYDKASFQYSYITIYFNDIDINELFPDSNNYMMYIRLGSHGNGFNAWYIQDPNLTITFYK